MKKFFLVSLIIAQSCIAFAQDSVRETQLPITENGTLIRFYYFNNEWIAMYKLVQTDSIKAIEIKNVNTATVHAFVLCRLNILHM